MIFYKLKSWSDKQVLFVLTFVSKLSSLVRNRSNILLLLVHVRIYWFRKCLDLKAKKGLAYCVDSGDPPGLIMIVFKSINGKVKSPDITITIDVFRSQNYFRKRMWFRSQYSCKVSSNFCIKINDRQDKIHNKKRTYIINIST